MLCGGHGVELVVKGLLDLQRTKGVEDVDGATFGKFLRRFCQTAGHFLADQTGGLGTGKALMKIGGAVGDAGGEEGGVHQRLSALYGRRHFAPILKGWGGDGSEEGGGKHHTTSNHSEVTPERTKPSPASRARAASLPEAIWTRQPEAFPIESKAPRRMDRPTPWRRMVGSTAR